MRIQHVTTVSNERIIVWAPAKLNFYLEILGRRPDGYHELATLMVPINLYDVLILERMDSGMLDLTCDTPELSTSSDNFISRAAALLEQKLGRSLPTRIHLKKRIPWGAGLGGGSSDAAAMLFGLNELWNLHLDTNELIEMGNQLGSDMAFFFQPQAAWCTGRGEIIEPIPMGEPLECVLVAPRVGVSTASVYQAFRQKKSDSPVSSSPNQKSICEAVALGDRKQIASLLRNDLQESAMAICPTIEKWFRRIKDTGAMGYQMTGSGSSLFALCSDRAEALRIATALQNANPPRLNVEDHDDAQIMIIQSCI